MAALSKSPFSVLFAPLAILCRAQSTRSATMDPVHIFSPTSRRITPPRSSFPTSHRRIRRSPPRHHCQTPDRSQIRPRSPAHISYRISPHTSNRAIRFRPVSKHSTIHTHRSFLFRHKQPLSTQTTHPQRRFTRRCSHRAIPPRCGVLRLPESSSDRLAALWSGPRSGRTKEEGRRHETGRVWEGQSGQGAAEALGPEAVLAG